MDGFTQQVLTLPYVSQSKRAMDQPTGDVFTLIILQGHVHGLGHTNALPYPTNTHCPPHLVTSFDHSAPAVR